MKEQFLQLAANLYELFKNDLVMENKRLTVKLEFDSKGVSTYSVTEHLDFDYDWGDDDV